jgi:hypothetical protein
VLVTLVIIPNCQLATNPLPVESVPGAMGTSLLGSFGPSPGYVNCVTTAPLTYAIHPIEDDCADGDP